MLHNFEARDRDIILLHLWSYCMIINKHIYFKGSSRGWCSPPLPCRSVWGSKGRREGGCAQQQEQPQKEPRKQELWDWLAWRGLVWGKGWCSLDTIYIVDSGFGIGRKRNREGLPCDEVCQYRWDYPLFQLCTMPLQVRLYCISIIICQYRLDYTVFQLLSVSTG